MGAQRPLSRRCFAAGALSAAAGLVGCAPLVSSVAPYRSTLSQGDGQWVDAIMATMSPEDKCAQVVIGPVCMVAGEMAVKIAGEKLEAGFSEAPVGGVVIDAGNISSAAQVTALCDNVRVLSSTVGGSANAFIAMAYEGIAQAARVTLGGGASKLTLDGVPDLLRELGVNLYMGPNLDPGSHLNREKTTADLDQEAGRLPVLCGQVSVVDCPIGFPGEQAAQAGVGQADDLTRPFRTAVGAGASMIRILDADDPSGTPLTLSRPWIHYLREDMGFEGVVLSSVIDYAASRAGLSLLEASVAFLEAGGDLVYVDDGPVEVASQLAGALADGTLDPDLLDSAVRRILQVKVSQGVQQI